MHLLHTSLRQPRLHADTVYLSEIRQHQQAGVAEVVAACAHPYVVHCCTAQTSPPLLLCSSRSLLRLLLQPASLHACATCCPYAAAAVASAVRQCCCCPPVCWCETHAPLLVLLHHCRQQLLFGAELQLHIDSLGVSNADAHHPTHRFPRLPTPPTTPHTLIHPTPACRIFSLMLSYHTH